MRRCKSIKNSFLVVVCILTKERNFHANFAIEKLIKDDTFYYGMSICTRNFVGNKLIDIEYLYQKQFDNSKFIFLILIYLSPL